MSPLAKKSKRIKVGSKKHQIEHKAQELRSSGVVGTKERAQKLLKEAQPSIKRPIVIGGETGKQRRRKRKVLRSVVKSFHN